MSVELDRTAGWSGPEHEIQYRAISPLAVTSFAVGLISIIALFDSTMAMIIPPIGILAGFVARRRIQQRPLELAGLKLAVLGMSLSLGFMVVGSSLHAYEYATEVPEGYQRISFDDLQAESKATGQLIPPTADELDGKDVFIKGYALATRESEGIKRFMLVWSKGDCCFGGNPPLTHKVWIDLKGDLELTYSTKVQKVAGTFHVDRSATALKNEVVYYLDAKYLK
jgi:hypothetical protein